MTRAEFIAAVAHKLGHPGSIPAALYQRIDAMQQAGVGVIAAVRKLRALA